jgi:hypothetical protein
MDGFLDSSGGGRTELRVHGVSGTPPEEMLCHPHPRQVAGDGMAGFYRRWWPGGPPTGGDRDVVGQRRREAYSWGGLTSGAASRALWLLLLPFMLLNFAFYMTPRPPWQERGSALREASAGAQRLLALTFTSSLVLSVVGVSMDLGGWQCGRSGSGCAGRHGWLSFLGWDWLDSPGRQLAVTSLLPAAVVGLLWYLGRSTWIRHELTRVPGRDAAEGIGAGKALLEDRRTWNGGGPVGRLRAAHVVAAFGVVGTLLLAPLASDSGLARALLVLQLVAIGVVVAVVTVWPEFAQRDMPLEGPHAGRPEPPATVTRRSRRWPAMPIDLVAAAGVVLYLLAFATAFLVRDDARPPTGGLPWFTNTVVWTFVVQAGLLLLVVALTALIGRSTRHAEQSPPLDAWVPATGRDGSAPPDRWGMAGLGTPVVGMLAWLLAGGFGAGLTLRTAGFLGTPAATGQADQPSGTLVVPAPYYWLAALSMVLAAIALVAVLWLALRWRAYRRVELQRLSRSLGTMAPQVLSSEERARKARLLSVAGTWARARLTDEAGRVVGSALIVTAAVVVAGCVAYGWLGPAWLASRANWLTTAGSFAVGALALWLITVGRNAYRSPGLRRTVGILWDFGTFWPRAVHPLAPPCYTERVIPDLLERVRWLAPSDGDVVVVSAHSQGTIIAAALVLQLERQQRDRVRLLTYGSPLQRVYARYFPAYFGPLALRRIGEVLPGLPPAAPAAGAPPAGARATGATWAWRNLFRPSDPIGGAVFYAYAISEQDNGDVDWQLMDPAIDPAMGDRAWPRAYGHSNYFRDPAFTTACELLEGHAPERQAAEAPTG